MTISSYIILYLKSFCGALKCYVNFDIRISYDKIKARQKRRALKLLSNRSNYSVLSEIMAEKEGFEPSHRLPRSTPLAGEPLQPYLGTSPNSIRN